MTDYVSREELKQRLGDAHFQNYGNAILILNGMPAADVVPAERGHWNPINPIKISRGLTKTFECSRCGAQVHMDMYEYTCEYNGCPYCFAIMDDEVTPGNKAGT